MTEHVPINQAELDPYELAEQIFATKVAQLQQAGQLLTPTQIADEEILADHFEALTALYRETCAEMGLVWPPPEWVKMVSGDYEG